MIDPVTAVATASAAFNIIKKGFEIGRDVEDMSSDLSRWMSAAADIKKAEEYNKNPPLFKKLFAGNAVEAEAMEIFLAKKKAEDMRETLRQIITNSRGPSAWQELIKTEADIRKRRQEVIYAQQESRAKLFEWILIGGSILAVLIIVFGGVWLIGTERGLW